LLALSGIFPSIAKFWIEHVWSNFEWVVNGYAIYMFFDGNISTGWTIGYIFLQLFLWALAYFFGMGSITFLDRDYPYLDSVLRPSIFYILGLSEHKEQYPFEDIEWPEDDEEEIDSEKQVDEESDKKSKKGSDDEDDDDIDGVNGNDLDDAQDINSFFSF